MASNKALEESLEILKGAKIDESVSKTIDTIVNSVLLLLHDYRLHVYFVDVNE